MPRVLIQLLGRPGVVGGTSEHVPARKSWALLAWLLLGDNPSSRQQCAELLFGEADDPLAALRWALSDLRRGIGSQVSLDGDPVRPALTGVSVDVLQLQHAHWSDAVELPHFGQELLGAATFSAAPRFELWLETERQRLAGVTVAVLHEAALACLASDAVDAAVRHARRVAALAPLDENGHVLLARSLVAAGRRAEAEEHVRAATDMLERELGVPGSEQLRRAAQPTAGGSSARSVPEIRARLEAGQAAVAAGALTEGLTHLQGAVDGAREADAPALLLDALLSLGTTLVHAARGSDEEGAAVLHEAAMIADQQGDGDRMARVHRELGYLAFLRGEYQRAFHWLNGARRSTDDPEQHAHIDLFCGACHDDVGDHDTALTRLDAALQWAQSAGDLGLAAYTRSFLGRSHLLLGDVDRAGAELDRSLDEARRAGRTAMLPWPMALRSEAARTSGDLPQAQELAEHAFAQGCRLGDPCWEGLAARARGMVASERGDVDAAVTHLDDAARRARRLPDTYVWAQVWIAQARCEVAVRHGLGHEDLLRKLEERASRHGMRDISDRAVQLRDRSR